jgi:hypothetical protein
VAGIASDEQKLIIPLDHDIAPLADGFWWAGFVFNFLAPSISLSRHCPASATSWRRQTCVKAGIWVKLGGKGGELDGEL